MRVYNYRPNIWQLICSFQYLKIKYQPPKLKFQLNFIDKNKMQITEKYPQETPTIEMIKLNMNQLKGHKSKHVKEWRQIKSNMCCKWVKREDKKCLILILILISWEIEEAKEFRQNIYSPPSYICNKLTKWNLVTSTKGPKIELQILQ